ncbi:MAG: Na/Pi symporter [Kiritimatiellia bacterium]
MSHGELFFLIFEVLGGLALFILGMSIMSDGLRTAAGSGLRILLTKATANRFAGLALGTLLAFLVHSSAASVMFVGFINAGLMNLTQAIAPMLGTNLGTSLSMQLVSFKLTDYAYVGIVFGLILQMAVPRPRIKCLGKALVGFGLLFLGMKVMSGAVAPHRDLLRQYLTGINGQALSGRLLGVGLAFALTAIIQSSGATIGMAFALADAGVFDSLWQTYPIVIGAQIGTCATAILGSIGTGIDSRRAAVGNLLTNVNNAVISILLAPLWIPLLEGSSASLVRQTANTHTFLMLQNCLVFMPIVPLYARFLRRIVPSRTPPPEPSFLRPELLATPEQALAARADYMEGSFITRNHFNEEVSRHAMTPVAGMYFSEYISALDRIVRHARNIALSEKEPQFWIKRSKLGKRVEFSPEPEPYPLVDPHEFRSRLQDEDDPCPPT